MKKFEGFDKFSAFDFENFFKQLKQMINKPYNPWPSITRRVFDSVDCAKLSNTNNYECKLHQQYNCGSLSEQLKNMHQYMKCCYNNCVFLMNISGNYLVLAVIFSLSEHFVLLKL